MRSGTPAGLHHFVASLQVTLRVHLQLGVILVAHLVAVEPADFERPFVLYFVTQWEQSREVPCHPLDI
jgi:hypothetical protein